MYSIFYNQKEYEVPERLYFQIVMCIIQFNQALVVDKPLFVNLFREKYISKIEQCPNFDYSKLRDEELKDVIDTTSITDAYVVIYTCKDCGEQNETVRKRKMGSGYQCYKCYKDELYFDEEYR